MVFIRYARYGALAMDTFWVEGVVSRKLNFDGDDFTQPWRWNRSGFALPCDQQPIPAHVFSAHRARDAPRERGDVTSKLDLDSRIPTPVNWLHEQLQK